MLADPKATAADKAVATFILDEIRELSNEQKRKDCDEARADTPIQAQKKPKTQPAPAAKAQASGARTGTGTGTAGNSKAKAKAKSKAKSKANGEGASASAFTYTAPLKVDYADVPSELQETLTIARRAQEKVAEVIINCSKQTETRTSKATDLVTHRSSSQALKLGNGTGKDRDGIVGVARAFLTAGRGGLTGDRLEEHAAYYQDRLTAAQTLAYDDTEDDEWNKQRVSSVASKMASSGGAITSVPLMYTMDLQDHVEGILTKPDAETMAKNTGASFSTTALMMNLKGKVAEICAHVAAVGETNAARQAAIAEMMPPKDASDQHAHFAGLQIATILMQANKKGRTPGQLAEVAGTDKVLHEHMAAGGDLLFVGEHNAEAHGTPGCATIDHVFFKQDGAIKYTKMSGTMFGF